jgi:hypothetical protein
MVPLSEQLLGCLQRYGRVVEQAPDPRDPQSVAKGRQLLLSYRATELFRPDDGPEGMYSCTMLDAALSVLKMSCLADGLVNVLPRRTEGLEFSYNGQQRKTRQILDAHYQARVLPMVNYFTGDSLEDPSSAGAHHTLRKPVRPLAP